MQKEELVLEDGKYTFQYEGGKMVILRYGEEWRDATGDKALGALFYEARESRDLLKKFYEHCKDMDDCYSETSGGWRSGDLDELLTEAKKLLGLK